MRTIDRTARTEMRRRAGREFAAQRKSQQLSQRAVAKSIGVSQSTISSWEKGNAEMPGWAVWALLTVLQIDGHWMRKLVVGV